MLHLEDLTKPACEPGSPSWAADHAAASVLRAHSAWSSLFDFLVAEDLLEKVCSPDSEGIRYRYNLNI